MSNGIAHNNLNDISKIYLETISDINKKEQEDDVKRWQQEESECGQNTRQQSPFKKKKVKSYKESLSNWRKDLREVTSDAEAVEVDDQPEIKEKKVKNKIKINPEFKEAVKQIGGELLEVKEVDSPDGETKDDNKSDDKKAEQDEAKKKKIADKERKLKMRILRVKMMATKQDAGASIVAGYEPEGEVVSELSRSTLSSYIQKGARDIAGKANDASIKGMSGKRKEADKGYEKTAKRVAGVSKAAGKLALKGTVYDKSKNEEVQVEGTTWGLYKGDGKPKGAAAAFAKKAEKDKKKPNPYGKRAKVKMLIKGFAEKNRMKSGNVAKEEREGNKTWKKFLEEGNRTSRQLTKSKTQTTGNISADRGDDEKKNRSSRKGLEKDLKKKGIGYSKGVGEYKYKKDGKEGTKKEVSYQTTPAKGMSKRRFGKVMRRLGRKHGQESVITKKAGKPAHLHDTQSKKADKSFALGKSKPGKNPSKEGETSGTKVRSGKLPSKTKGAMHYGN